MILYYFIILAFYIKKNTNFHYFLTGPSNPHGLTPTVTNKQLCYGKLLCLTAKVSWNAFWACVFCIRNMAIRRVAVYVFVAVSKHYTVPTYVINIIYSSQLVANMRR